MTSSTDKLIKKIFISENFDSYKALTILKRNYSSVYKAMELNGNQILSCSDDGFVIVWENINKKDNDENYKNNIINENNPHYSNFNKLNFIIICLWEFKPFIIKFLKFYNYKIA